MTCALCDGAPTNNLAPCPRTDPIPPADADETRMGGNSGADESGTSDPPAFRFSSTRNASPPSLRLEPFAAKKRKKHPPTTFARADTKRRRKRKRRTRSSRRALVGCSSGSETVPRDVATTTFESSAAASSASRAAPSPRGWTSSETTHVTRHQQRYLRPFLLRRSRRRCRRRTTPIRGASPPRVESRLFVFSPRAISRRRVRERPDSPRASRRRTDGAA